MSRADPSAARMQQPYDPTTDCACGHLSTFHLQADDQPRGACSAWGCGCKTFTEARGNE